MPQTLFVNATFITLDPALPRAEALLAEGEHIRAIGSEREVRSGASRGQVIDLRGATVLPGLIDSHVHADWTGLALEAVPLFNAHSLTEVWQRLQERATQTPPGNLIVAMGFEWRFLAERRWPTPDELDTYLPEHPVFLLHQTGHESMARRLALPALALTETTPGIGRDERGTPTGHLSDLAHTHATNLFLNHYGEQIGWERVLHRAAEDGIRHGLTTLHCLDPLPVVETLLRIEHPLPLRVVPYTESTDIERVHALGLPRVGGCRAWWIDGDFDPHTVALLEPYDDCPTCRGTLFFDDDHLGNLVARAHTLGMQICMHAIGDRAIEQALNAYAHALEQHPRPDHRHRIEHFDLPAPHQIVRARQLGIHLAVQPAFNHVWGHQDYLPLVGEARTARIDAFRDWHHAGLPMGTGSDAPITPLDPRVAIHGLLNHSQPHQRLDLTTALRMATVENARLAFEEKEKGTLEVGKLADLTVLGANPYRVDPSELKDIPIIATVVGGRVAWGSHNLD